MRLEWTLAILSNDGARRLTESDPRQGDTNRGWTLMLEKRH